ncbi:MAG TPA: T9SS type A sorting domain-containing protein [Paludibacteraceae bacterium]|mgnify:CR=1 FL=1|nr:T9SS type A sorting domain-containing protein [Paludibacteraceae bacterium]HOV83629.1 T9SS type A sorting domain-containing protein [Paludibacteraceae bacterium]
MKKITFLMGACLAVAALQAQTEPTPTVTTLWEKSAASGTLPAWFLTTSNKTRGIGASNEYVFVATRDGAGDKNIFVYDAANGDSITALKTDLLTLGTFVLNDVGATDDGKIIAANLGANTNFKIYMYDNLTADPVVILHIPDAAPGGRTGDLFTVVGDYSKGTAKIYTATAANPSDIYVLEMEAGQWKTERTLVKSLPLPKAAVAPGVGVKPNGDLFWKAGGQKLHLVTADNILAEPGDISMYSNSVKYIGYSSTYNLDYIALFTYGGLKECAEIISLTPGDLTTCKIIGRTPTLGTNANAGGTGDVEVRYDQNGNPIIYVVSTNNGFGAYKVEGLDITTGLPMSPKKTEVNIYPNPTKETVYFTEAAKKVKLFSISGQLLKEANNVDYLNVKELNGIYLLEIESQRGEKVFKRLIIE